MESDILLSICIPTYNGGDYLIENLCSLIPQLEKTSFQVELIISDNGTQGVNYQIIEEYLRNQKYRIDFIHHPESLGVRGNFAFAVSRAHGKYVYLLGDDDVLAPDFVEIVCSLLSKQDCSIFYLNFLAGDGALQNARLFMQHYCGGITELSFADFLRSKELDITFMSSIVFLKENWDAGLQKVRVEHYGYEWLATVLLGTALNPGRCLIFYFPLVLQRNPVKPWSKDYPIYKCIGQQSIFQDLDEYVCGLSKRKYIDNIIQYRPTLYTCVSKDPSYYQKYEEDFRKTLAPRDYKTLKRCLHSRMRRVYFLYYKCEQYFKLFKIGIKKIQKVI